MADKNYFPSKETKVSLAKSQRIPKIRREELAEVVETIASNVGPQAKNIIDTIR